MPTSEPLKLQAGDSLRFDKVLDDYSGADGWILTYRMVSPSADAFSFSTASSTSTFSVSVLAATTQLWVAGVYLLVGQVSRAGERYTIYEFEITIEANSDTESVLDYRTYAQRMLALIEATISGAVQRQIISYSINGRSVTAKTNAELFQARDYFRSEIEQEKSAGKNRRILTRFVR